MKKMNLQALNVQSFVTESKDDQATVKGGIRVITDSGQYTCPEYCGASYIMACPTQNITC